MTPDNQKQIEILTQRLNETQEQLELALEAAIIGVWVWDVKSDKLTWNPNMFKLFRVNPYEWPEHYSGFIDNVHLDDVERVEKALQYAVKTKSVYDCNYRLRHHPEVIIRGRGRCYYNTDGEHARMIGVCIEELK